ncbi:DinB family protein [Bacillus pinisoli]|uniref:DinB family protein n=1 Tax=Bacillus pinisoli TaxID=2901866 RepID=UPI001FF4F5D9|nr:DinB family protein [Bacillus pinisoli]
MIDYNIRQKEGFSSKIGDLVSMLEHTREVTLSELQNLTITELDFLPDQTANPIGALLMHIASVEFVYQRISFESRDINDKEREQWIIALELGEKARSMFNNKPLQYYVSVLNNLREKTISELKLKNDTWLYEEKTWGYNNYWIWYHVMEDEISHRGQIRTIKRQLRQYTSNNSEGIHL